LKIAKLNKILSPKKFLAITKKIFKTSELAIADYIEKGKKTSPAPSITVALSFKSTNIYITPEIEHVESLNDKLEAPEIVKLLDNKSGLPIDEPIFLLTYMQMMN
ncbi:7425_t:CDS:2, partial [Gigaspora margarita]